nr:MAG TPA: hypothetical protein [Caudoviricetes sp.]
MDLKSNSNLVLFPTYIFTFNLTKTLLTKLKNILIAKANSSS